MSFNCSHESNLIEKEVYQPIILKRLGHVPVALTMDIYTHFFERKKKKDAKCLQDVQQSMQSSS